jgi:hypothetical protein
VSYDLYLMAEDALGDEYCQYEVGNYTSNVSRMWAEALGFPLAEMDGSAAGKFIAALEAAVGRMDDDREHYEAMNPPNGWGDAEGARRYLATLLEGCRRFPATTIHVSR